MFPASEKFARHITGDHEVTTRVQSFPDPLGEPVDISSYFEGGTLRIGRQNIRRSGDITLIDHDGGLLPITADELVHPYGTELFIEHGIIYPDGTEELIPQGMLRITGISVRYPTLSLTLNDRAWIVAGARLEAPLTIARNTLYTDAIRKLLITAYPQIELELIASDDITPTIVLEDQADPWAEAQKMATAIGYSLWFDRYGICRLEPSPDPTAADPVWTYDDASLEFIPREDGHWFNLATADQEISWDTDEAYNRVVVIGENVDNDNVFRGVASDTDPTSPTLYGGPFGKRPMFMASELITSNAMAERSAVTSLQGQIGIMESLRIPAIAHPGLDLDDSILVVRDELGINQIHVVDGFDLPLRAGIQTIDTRRRRVVLQES